MTSDDTKSSPSPTGVRLQAYFPGDGNPDDVTSWIFRLNFDAIPLSRVQKKRNFWNTLIIDVDSSLIKDISEGVIAKKQIKSPYGVAVPDDSKLKSKIVDWCFEKVSFTENEEEMVEDAKEHLPVIVAVGLRTT